MTHTVVVTYFHLATGGSCSGSNIRSHHITLVQALSKCWRPNNTLVNIGNIRDYVINQLQF